jgi:hypothetical protein
MTGQFFLIRVISLITCSWREWEFLLSTAKIPMCWRKSGKSFAGSGHLFDRKAKEKSKRERQKGK